MAAYTEPQTTPTSAGAGLLPLFAAAVVVATVVIAIVVVVPTMVTVIVALATVIAFAAGFVALLSRLMGPEDY